MIKHHQQEYVVNILYTSVHLGKEDTIARFFLLSLATAGLMHTIALSASL